jgi:hypothetical protein
MRKPLTERQVYLVAGLAAAAVCLWVVALAYAVVLVWKVWS